MILMVGLGIAQPHTPANLIMNARQSGACLFLSRYLIIFQGSNYDLGIPMAILMLPSDKRHQARYKDFTQHGFMQLTGSHGINVDLRLGGFFLPEALGERYGHPLGGHQEI